MKILIDEKRNLHPFLEEAKEIAKGIYYMLGSKAEVIIHDLSNPRNSLFFIAGELTKRKLGAPATDVMLKALRKSSPENSFNYQTKGKDGHLYKSSMMFIKDENKDVIGCLGINYDITDVLMVTNILNDFSSTETLEKSEEGEESFEDSINDVLKKMLEKAKEKIGKPVPFMNKDDKLALIKNLDEKGCFLIKGSIEIVADDLKVSRYTVYNYIKEIGVSD